MTGMTALDADSVALLKALRSPATIPQLCAKIAKAGAPLSEARVRAAAAAQELAGHVVASIRDGELRYERVRAGKRAVRQVLRQTDPGTTVTLQALALLDRLGPLTPVQLGSRLRISQFRAEQLLRYVASAGRAEQIRQERIWRITLTGLAHLQGEAAA